MASQPKSLPSLRAKIHKWLSGLGSHGIYDAAALAEDFKKDTGENACWPVHTRADTVSTIEGRGLGGNLDENLSGMCAWGWEIARALAEKYGHNNICGQYLGRGMIFRAALASLKEEHEDTDQGSA